VTVLALVAFVASATAASDPPSLAAKCGDTYGITATPSWLTASDGTRLYAVETGTGRTGVVLVHESPADLCGWLPYAESLADAGIRTLALDLRGFGDSRPPDRVPYYAYDRDLRAAVTRLRADGASRVVLVGASFGGATVLTYGSQLDTNGVVSLSGELALHTGGLNADAGVKRLRVPLLLVGSRHDSYLPVGDALKLLHDAGTKNKRTAFYPGVSHGWDIVEDAPYAAKARALVLAWLRNL
jgi:pimeloyl-ACP methyl ester carboxylesterase